MVYINEQGYLERKAPTPKKSNCMSVKRNWWFVTYTGIMMSITFNKKYFGKRIRFKVEVVK